MTGSAAKEERVQRAYGPPAKEDGTHLDEGLLVHGDEKPRCWSCNSMFAIYLTRPWIVKCRRCKSVNRSPDNPSDRKS